MPASFIIVYLVWSYLNLIDLIKSNFFDVSQSQCYTLSLMLLLASLAYLTLTSQSIHQVWWGWDGRFPLHTFIQRIGNNSYPVYSQMESIHLSKDMSIKSWCLISLSWWKKETAASLTFLGFLRLLFGEYCCETLKVRLDVKYINFFAFPPLQYLATKITLQVSRSFSGRSSKGRWALIKRGEGTKSKLAKRPAAWTKKKRF